MNQAASLFAKHDCERLPDRAWLEQITTEILALDAEEGLLLPLEDEELAEPAMQSESGAAPETAPPVTAPPVTASTETALTGIAWLSEIARRTLPPSDDDSLTEEGEDDPAALLRARQLTGGGDLRAALAAYATLLPQDAGLESAAEDLEALARVQPRNAEILQLLGDVQYARERWEDACVSYQRALALLARETP